jgi:hypothetical protein
MKFAAIHPGERGWRLDVQSVKSDVEQWENETLLMALTKAQMENEHENFGSSKSLCRMFRSGDLTPLAGHDNDIVLGGFLNTFWPRGADRTCCAQPI